MDLGARDSLDLDIDPEVHLISEENERADLAVFQILANELPETDPKQTIRRIRNKLRRSDLGEFDQARVDQLRRLAFELEQEFRKYARSVYANAATGANVASIKDFDTARMATDFRQRYPAIEERDMRGIVDFAIYFYYLK